ncbi:unnamed protein product [Prorocentrum cordatum]|uniref:Uncharacterized protein n=1 Tax=Prorocentrum cordatum TaxID=2364126 RepID=A0ABN9TBF0_9DINO|nr:unnamed protein product [Polarella glacialis]
MLGDLDMSSDGDRHMCPKVSDGRECADPITAMLHRMESNMATKSDLDGIQTAVGKCEENYNVLNDRLSTLEAKIHRGLDAAQEAALLAKLEANVLESQSSLDAGSTRSGTSLPASSASGASRPRWQRGPRGLAHRCSLARAATSRTPTPRRSGPAGSSLPCLRASWSLA